MDSLHFVSGGVCGVCPECASIHGYDSMEQFSLDVQSGKVPNEGSFSWSTCDRCGSTLGGNRYAAHGVDDSNELVHCEVCEDCIFELAGYVKVEGEWE